MIREQGWTAVGVGRVGIISGPDCHAIRGCKFLVPPPSSHGHQELDRVAVSLCLRANIAELRLLISIQFHPASGGFVYRVFDQRLG
jgi:hypothetical protein